MRPALLLLAFGELALTRLSAQTNTPDKDRAAQQRTYLESLCTSMGGTSADCADPEAFQKRLEKQMQDEIDRFNRRQTERVEKQVKPPGKQKFQSVTRLLT